MDSLTTSLQGLPPKQALVYLLAAKASRHQELLELATTARQQSEEAIRKAQVSAGPSLASNTTSLLSQPSHPMSDLLLPSRYKVLYGGRDSAKSWTVAEALVRIGAVSRELILCTREFQNAVKDSVHRLLVNTIWRLGLQDWYEVTSTSIKCPATGTEFIFKGLRHNVQEIKSLEGATIAWVEEAQHTSDESWEVLIPTMRREGSEIWMTFNVTDEQAPTYTRFVTNTPPGAIKHLINYHQNPFLTETSKKEIAYLKRVDYSAYEHVYEGKAKKISDDLIFAGRFVVNSIPEGLHKQAQRLLFGADWGFAQDPSALIRMFIVDRTLYIEHEAYGVGVEFAGAMAKDGRGELEQLFDSVPNSRDWTIKADNARPETISFMKGKGFRIEAAEKWKGSVEDGISHIKGFEQIVIDPRCKHTIEEARLYRYKRDKITMEVLPVIIDKHNHCWDAIRYGLDGYIQRAGGLAIWEKMAEMYEKTGGTAVNIMFPRNR